MASKPSLPWSSAHHFRNEGDRHGTRNAGLQAISLPTRLLAREYFIEPKKTRIYIAVGPCTDTSVKVSRADICRSFLMDPTRPTNASVYDPCVTATSS